MEKAQQKVLNYLDHYMDFDYLQKLIKEIRLDMGIPVDGYSLKNKEEPNFLFKIATDSIFVPEELLKKNTKIEALNKIKAAVQKIGNDFPIRNLILDSFFKLYLLYNIKFYDVLENMLVGTSIANIKDTSLCRVGIFKNTTNNEFKNYPVYIKINPSATQRDVIDYIKNNWHRINSLLNLKKDKKTLLGRVRTKNAKIALRNSIIYQNKSLKIREIVKIINNNTDNPDEVVDEGLVSKIISLEKKRRKEVRHT